MKKRIKIGVLLLFFCTLIAYITLTAVFVRDVPSLSILDLTWNRVIFIAVLFILLYVFNSLRVFELAKAFTSTFTFKDSLIFTMGGIFLGLITPFQSGGIPFQIYLLSKRGVHAGEGASLLFIRGIQSFLIFLITIPFTFIFFSQLFDNNLVSALFRYLLGFYISVIIIIGIAVLFTEGLKRLVCKIKHRGLKEILLKVLGETNNFKYGLVNYLKKAKLHFVFSTVYTALSLYLMFSMTYFIVLICGGKNDFFLSFNIQLLLTYLLAFVPTPGSSGFAEGSGALFYSILIPKNNILIYIFMWRLITTYIPSLIGFFSISAYLKAFLAEYDST